MSLLILIYTLLGALAPLAGVSAETCMPASPPAARELVLETRPECGLDAAGQQRMQQALQQRFRLVGLQQVETRCEGATRFVVLLPGAVAQQLDEVPAMCSELEQLLNTRMSLQLLRVHPHSDRLLRHARVRDAIDAYEKAMAAYEMGQSSSTVAPGLPPLPERLQLPDYMLAEQPVMSASDASGHYEYLVLQRPEAAAAEELLVDENQVEKVEVVADSVSITFTATGAERIFTLTNNMKLGQDRLALVLDGSVVSAPVVHAPLRREVRVSGLSEGERELISSGFGIPLPAPLRIVELRPAR